MAPSDLPPPFHFSASGKVKVRISLEFYQKWPTEGLVVRDTGYFSGEFHGVIKMGERGLVGN